MLDKEDAMLSGVLVAGFLDALVHADAIPVLLLGVSFGPDGTPEAHIATADGVADCEIETVLREALATVEAGKAKRGHRRGQASSN